MLLLSKPKSMEMNGKWYKVSCTSTIDQTCLKWMLIIVLEKLVTELYMYDKKKEIISNIWLNFMSCLNRFELEQAHNEEIQKIEEKRYCHH